MSQQSKHNNMMPAEDEEANKESFEHAFKLTQHKNVRGLKKAIWCMSDIDGTGSAAGKDQQWVCHCCVPPCHGAGDPTPEESDDQSRARPEDAGKEGGGRCFQCNCCFGSLHLIVHQCRMFHSEQCLSKFKDSLVHPNPADADVTKHVAVPGTPAQELRPTVLAFDSPPPGRSKTSSKPKGQTKKNSARAKLKNKMSAAN